MSNPGVRMRAPMGLMAAALVMCSACATAPSYYSWGGYEELIYANHAKPGALPLDQQIAQMEMDRQAANGASGRLPPGWHAQLAALYSQSGNVDSARSELLAEKAAFPESATLMDRLIANLDAGKPEQGVTP
jgi:hypothetical protein